MSPKEEPAPTLGVATVLSAGTRAVGELHSKEDLVLVDSFEGRLLVDRAVRIMPEARMDGEVRAERILVLGQTHGRLLAQQRIEIKAGAVVLGEVMAPQIRIHEGVILNAKVHMSGTMPAPGTAAFPIYAPQPTEHQRSQVRQRPRLRRQARRRHPERRPSLGRRRQRASGLQW